MAGLRIVTQPASEPVTLAEAKAHLVVDFDDDDDLIAGYVAAARSHCEAFLKQALLPTVFEYRIDGRFPGLIRLPVGPVLAAADVAIEYVDDAGDMQTLAPSAYQVGIGETAIVAPAYGATWPSVQPVLDAVRVRFTAGNAVANDIPRAVRVALLMVLGDFYAHRENTAAGMPVAELPLAARNLMMPFVRHG